MNQIFVWARLHFEGIHRWASAPETVKFLQHPHHHNFTAKVGISVTELDREIEFLILRRYIQSGVSSFYTRNDNIYQLDKDGCEHAATKLLDYLKDFYPGRSIMVEVQEDDDQGVKIWYTE